jgi:MFS family permease
MGLSNKDRTFATSVTVPAIPLLQEAFNVSRTEAILPLTMYTLGIAIGPLFIAPLSETLGRRWVYIGTCTCFMAFTAGAGASTTFASLLACRFLAAFLGSAGLAMGGGTVADIWALEKAGKGPALLFILGPFLGPTLGPLAGAYILHEYNQRWRFSQWVILMFGAPVYLGILCMKETSKAQILKPKRQAGTLTAAHVWARTKHHFRNGVLRPSRMLITEPIVLSLTIYTAYAYAMIFSFFGSLPYVLELEYGFNSRQVGLAFLSVIIGYILANFMFGAFDRTLYARASKAAGGVPAPEHRLYSALVGSFFIPVGLFW